MPGARAVSVLNWNVAVVTAEGALFANANVTPVNVPACAAPAASKAKAKLEPITPLINKLFMTPPRFPAVASQACERAALADVAAPRLQDSASLEHFAT